MSTIQKQKKIFAVRRLVLNAMLVAMYVVLGYLRIPIGNSFRISVAPFTVILCALAFGPVDGLLVGFLGEFLTQILGPYGLTPTTPLWCMGETVRGLTLGLCSLLFFKKQLSAADRPQLNQVIAILACCIITGILASLANTCALYIDSKLLGYYSYAMVFGALIGRMAISVVVSGLLGYISLTIITTLRKAKLI